MPFVYHVAQGVVADTFSTHATPGTAIDAAFIKPGSSRVVNLTSLRVGGRGAGLTALSGITFRLKVYPTTAAAGGTAITPRPVDDRAPAAVHTAGAASAGVTVGTGTLQEKGGCDCGASGPGGWTAPTPDHVIALDGAATKSIDLFPTSGTASLPYAFHMETQE